MKYHLQSCNFKQFENYNFVILEPKLLLIGHVYNGSIYQEAISTYKIAITRVIRKLCSVGVSKWSSLNYIPASLQTVSDTSHAWENSRLFDKILAIVPFGE